MEEVEEVEADVEAAAGVVDAEEAGEAAAEAAAEEVEGVEEAAASPVPVFQRLLEGSDA